MNPDAIFLCLFITLFIIGGIFIVVSSLCHASRTLEQSTNFSVNNPMLRKQAVNSEQKVVKRVETPVLNE